MQKINTYSSLLFLLSMIFTFNAKAQEVVFEDIYDAAADVGIPDGMWNQAWAGAETPDGGLLVVGQMGHDQNKVNAYITKYSPDFKDRETIMLGNWRLISDIKKIDKPDPHGLPQYIIVGTRQGSSSVPDWSCGPIAALISLDADTDLNVLDIEFTHYLSGSPSLKMNCLKGEARGVSPVFDKFNQPDGFIIAVNIGDSKKPNGTSYLLKVNNDLEYEHSNWSASLGVLRLPHSVAVCGDHYVVAGQDGPQNMVVTAWNKSDLTMASDYRNKALTHHQKPKMAFATDKGVLISGGFDNGSGTLHFGLAYFRDLKNLDGVQKKDIHCYDQLSKRGSYSQSITNRKAGGWIMAGKMTVGSRNDDMSALIVDRNFKAIKSFGPYGGAILDNNVSDSDLANYVIQLSNGNYALLGRADYRKDAAGQRVGSTYVVVVKE